MFRIARVAGAVGAIAFVGAASGCAFPELEGRLPRETAIEVCEADTGAPVPKFWVLAWRRGRYCPFGVIILGHGYIIAPDLEADTRVWLTKGSPEHPSFDEPGWLRVVLAFGPPFGSAWLYHSGYEVLPVAPGGRWRSVETGGDGDVRWLDVGDIDYLGYDVLGMREALREQVAPELLREFLDDLIAANREADHADVQVRELEELRDSLATR